MLSTTTRRTCANKRKATSFLIRTRYQRQHSLSAQGTDEPHIGVVNQEVGQTVNDCLLLHKVTGSKHEYVVQ